MRTSRNILLTLVGVLLIGPIVATSTLEAQKVCITTDLRVFQLKNSASDSVTGFQITYPTTNSTFTQLAGQYPDSIRLVAAITGDSIYNITIRAKAMNSMLGTYSSVKIDTIGSATAVAKVVSWTAAYTDYQAMDFLGFSAVAAASGNAANKATASKLHLRLERWFSLMPTKTE